MDGQGQKLPNGQTIIEIIIAVTLIALAIVVVVGGYGDTVFEAFRCTTRSVLEMKGISFSCPKPAGGPDDVGSDPKVRPGPNPQPRPGADGGADDAADTVRMPSASGQDPSAADTVRMPAAPAIPSTPRLADDDADPGEELRMSSERIEAEAALLEAKEILQLTPTGQNLVQFLEDNGIAVSLDPSDGYYYDPDRKEIVLNPPFDPEQLLLKLAHEANHAIYDVNGRTADINTETREEYVRKMLLEEAVGTVGPILLKRELEQAGRKITASFPLETEYNAAYQKAVDELRSANPEATPEELEAAGRRGGFDAVLEGYQSGKVVASPTNPPLTYPEYYGQLWDANQQRQAP